VFAKVEKGLVSDTAVRQALIDIYHGRLFRDPVTNAPIGRYSLLHLAKWYLNKDRTKDKDGSGWRLRYN
jgi:hypothetical protein